MRNPANLTVEGLESRQLMSATAANLDGREVYADFTRDGKADVVSLNGGRLRFAAGLGDGRFATVDSSVEALRMRPVTVAGGDVNGDGLTDLIVSGVRGKGDGAKGIIAILIGLVPETGDPEALEDVSFTFQKIEWNVKAPVARGLPLVGDFDGDGRDDLASVHRSTGRATLLLPYIEQGNVYLRAGGTFPTPYRAGGQIGLADDADGPDDLLVINKNGRAFWSGGGVRPSFKSVEGLSYETEIVESSGQVDGADFLLWRAGAVHAVDFNMGDTATHEALAAAPRRVSRRLVAADFDGDGRLDLLARGSAGRSWFVPDMDSDQSGT